jgi:hypothetical protein
MEPIYDRHGRVRAWIRDAKIYSLRGQVMAFVQTGRNVVSARGRHLGVFDDGNVRDHRGAVVGWLRGSSGGPLKPTPSVPPVPPVPSVPPVPPVPPVAPVQAIPSLSWSSADWDAFING